MTTEPFNPLAMESLAHSIVTRMTEMTPVPLDDVPLFPGAGLYAIYYHGEFPAYADLAALNRPVATVPIYVGKSVPAGGRKGVEVAASTDTKALANRVR
ncbi:MAG: Eco29kI family restriction endonuclease, partial [Propionibacteriaceae bacterium]|nr:Eco29kI family restriction endonuclease [Propionibacteriaceae bacterium]